MQICNKRLFKFNSNFFNIVNHIIYFNNTYMIKNKFYIPCKFLYMIIIIKFNLFLKNQMF